MTDKLSTLLGSGDSLIVTAWPSPALCTILQRHAAHVASMGRNVLVLDEEYPGDNKEFSEVGKLFLRDVFNDQTDFAKGNGYACSQWRFSEMLRCNRAETWLKRLGLILIPDTDQVFGNLFEWELMAHRLRDRLDGDPPQFVIVVGARYSPEPSLRRILSALDREVKEYSVLQSGPKHVWWNLWSSQQSSDYAHVYKKQGTQYCGIEPPLAHYAGQEGISSSLLQRHPAIAVEDHCEALQHGLGEVHIQGDADGGWMSATPGTPFVGAITLRDHCGNPWRSLQACLSAGQRDVLVNIVSRHTLLSAYQVANAAFFAHQPLAPLSPMLIDRDAFTVLVQLLLRIDKNERFALARLQEALDAAALSSRPARALSDFKHDLNFYKITNAATQSLTVRTAWDWRQTREGLKHGRTAYVSLGGHDISVDELNWLREFQVQDNAGTVFRILRQDHVGQYYQRGKVCVFDHKTYQVDRIDWRDGKIYVAHDDALDAPDYRDVRRVELLEPLKDELHGGEEHHADGLTITAKIYRAHFRVATKGYYASSDHWASPDCPYVPTDTPVREYTHGRVAQLSFTMAKRSLLTPGAAVALAQWLNEAAITFFPESHPYFLAVADVADSAYPTQEPAAGIVPRLQKNRPAPRNHAQILIFEDSHGDLGIARAFIWHWQYLLDICGDYLAWFLQEASSGARIGDPITLENSSELLPPRDFLAYGREECDTRIDLQGLFDALSQIPIQGALTQRRHKALLEGDQLVDKSAKDREECCDFCSADISGGESEVFPDGRVRCMACATYGIDMTEQLPALYKAALDYFKNTLKVEFAENFDIKLATPVEIAEIREAVFIPTSGYDSRATGLAQARSHTGTVLGETRHTVLIESGFGPEETTGTLVHELTHIWQYNMLDHRRMEADHGLLLIEGHAILVELDFLRCQQTNQTLTGGDSERLKRALSTIESMISSDSVYGHGYKLVAQMGDFNKNVEALFKWLQVKYSHA